MQLVIATVSIVEGLTVDSSGTLGFGLQTVMDMVTTFVIVWRYTGKDGHVFSQKKEFKSVVILTVLLFLLAIGTATGAIYNITQEFKPFKEYRLMAICTTGFAIYIVLGWIKLYIGAKLHSKAVYIDGVSTVGTACTAVALLASLIAYKISKAWYLDDIVALIVASLMLLYSLRLFYKDIYFNGKYI